MARSAGTSATVAAHEEGYVHLKLPSREVRKVRSSGMATIGNLGNVDWKNEVIGSAGRKRHMGIRPTVRELRKTQDLILMEEEKEEPESVCRGQKLIEEGRLLEIPEKRRNIQINTSYKGGKSRMTIQNSKIKSQKLKFKVKSFERRKK